MPTPLRFPETFLWGTAVASHQVEGGNTNNDWWLWEQQSGHIRHDHSSRVACDWWHRAEEDFARAADLKLNAQRLSVEWSRIEPEEGRFDAEAVARYRAMLVRLRELHIEPIVCLFHFTLPQWVSARGGFETSWAVDRFARFVEHGSQELGEHVRWWLTVNEPMVYVALGWFMGRWPPAKKRLPEALKVARNLVRAHALAYRILHRRDPEARVSAAMQISRYVPSREGSHRDDAVVHLRDWLGNRMWLDAAEDGVMRPPLGAFERVPEAVGAHDFIGFQHYFTYPLEFSASSPGALFLREMQRPRPDTPPFMGEFRPEGLGFCANELKRYGKPLLVTEHGLLDNTDAERPAHLIRSLASLHRAMQDGAVVLGYLH